MNIQRYSAPQDDDSGMQADHAGDYCFYADALGWKDEVAALTAQLTEARQQLADANAEIAERKASFELQWKASRRATKMWQEAHPGNDLTWPDMAHLCVWLMEQIAASQAECERLRTETEDFIKRDAYDWIADHIDTKDGYSVQDHVSIMKEVIEQCADFFHDFAPSDDGGNDTAVSIAKNLRYVLSGELEAFNAALTRPALEIDHG